MLDENGAVDSDDDMPDPKLDKKPTKWNAVSKGGGSSTDTEAKQELAKAAKLAGATNHPVFSMS